MITISTTSEDEAKDIAGVLSGILPGGLPRDRDYRVFLNGHEYSAGDPVGRTERRNRMRELIRDAGPAGISVRDLGVQLYREGRNIPRVTLYRWVQGDRDAGLVRPAEDHGRWAWHGTPEAAR